jgi:hypothetical protein
MSRYTYAGKFVNPTEGFVARENDEGLGFVWITERVPCDCGCPRCTAYDEVERLHSMHGKDPKNPIKGFEGGAEEAAEWIEQTAQGFEEDYDNYREENHYEIARMEQYEDWKNEY